MGKVTSISIQKGGPGKTTVCRNLGEEVSEKGRKVLLIDNDPQGNLTQSLLGDSLPTDILTNRDEGGRLISEPGRSNTALLYKEGHMAEPLDINENLSLIGATKHLADMADSGSNALKMYQEFKLKLEILSEVYDDIFIDCPPSASNLQTSAHISSDFLLIPTHLNKDSVVGVEEQIKSSAMSRDMLNPKLALLGIVINSKKSQKILVEDMFYDELKNDYGDKLFETVINESVKVSEARALNLSVKNHSPTSLQAEQFQSLTDEYLRKIVEI